MQPTDLTHYVGFGLGIHSALPLPELLTGNTRRDVIVRLECEGSVPSEVVAEHFTLNHIRSETGAISSQICEFTVRGGREIVVHPLPGAPIGVIRQFLMGNVMATILHQRGMLVLHASAVEIDGHTIAIAGESGAGKSSLAAILVSRGHGFLTDDVLPINAKSELPQVSPGYPQIRISPKVASSLGLDPNGLIFLHPTEEKRGWRVTQRFVRSSRELKCVYVLPDDRCQDKQIHALSPAEAVIEVERHSHPTRFFQPNGGAHFQQSSWLAKSVPFFRLRRSFDLSALPELAFMVEKHVASLA